MKRHLIILVVALSIAGCVSSRPKEVTDDLSGDCVRMRAAYDAYYLACPTTLRCSASSLTTVTASYSTGTMTCNSGADTTLNRRTVQSMTKAIRAAGRKQ